jgi:hypothetical protein
MNHEFFAADVSDSFGRFDACKKCGVTWDEAISEAGLADIGRHPCTGNAYICRVARKLDRLVAADSEWSGPTGPPPWTINREQFANLVARAAAAWVYDPKQVTVRNLAETVRTDPTVCLILADAIEEAGCFYPELLEALRTP